MMRALSFSSISSASSNIADTATALSLSSRNPIVFAHIYVAVCTYSRPFLDLPRKLSGRSLYAPVQQKAIWENAGFYAGNFLVKSTLIYHNFETLNIKFDSVFHSRTCQKPAIGKGYEKILVVNVFCRYAEQTVVFALRMSFCIIHRIFFLAHTRNNGLSIPNDLLFGVLNYIKKGTIHPKYGTCYPFLQRNLCYHPSAGGSLDSRSGMLWLLHNGRNCDR